MGEKKWELRFYTVPEWQKEEEYLRQRHREGWRFLRLRGLGLYEFEACPPEDVVYRLDYNAAGGTGDYLLLFRDCGWEYLQDCLGYSYFRKPAGEAGDEDIFCDDQSRLDMMVRVFKGRLVPLLAVFLSCLVPNLLRLLLFPEPGGLAAFLVALLSLVSLLYLYCFIRFGALLWRYWRSVRR